MFFFVIFNFFCMFGLFFFVFCNFVELVCRDEFCVVDGLEGECCLSVVGVWF